MYTYMAELSIMLMSAYSKKCFFVISEWVLDVCRCTFDFTTYIPYFQEDLTMVVAQKIDKEMNAWIETQSVSHGV